MREKLIELCERSLANDGNGREMRFVGGDVVPAVRKAIQEWIPVSERLPEADKNVLVITTHGSFKVARCNFYKNGTEVDWGTNDGLGERAITHWMPLPEPPKGD